MIKRSLDLYRSKARIYRVVTTNDGGRQSESETTLFSSIPCSWQDKPAEAIGWNKDRDAIEAAHTHRIHTPKNVSSVLKNDRILNLTTNEKLIVCSVSDDGDRGEGWCIYARSA